jgi:predicted porin
MTRRYRLDVCKLLLAALSAASASYVYADDQITLYGITDAGIGYVSNSAAVEAAGAAGRPALLKGGSNLAFASGTWNGNRWGLKGSEDLGGGTQAIFRLENGFNIGTGAAGQGGAEFGRYAYLGLADERYGKFTMGRQYEPMIDLVGTLGGNFVLSEVAAHPGDIDNFDHSSRSNSSLKYQSPTIGGFKLEGLYAPGGQPGNLSLQSSSGFGVQYAGGPLLWGIAYSHADNQKIGASAKPASWVSTADSGFGSSIDAGYASTKARDVVGTSATYQVGATTLGVNYSHTAFTPGLYSTFHRIEKFDAAGIFAIHSFSVALRAGVGYSFLHASAPTANASAATYHQFNLSSFYRLSTATELYALTGYQRALGSTLDVYGNIIAATASVGDAANGISSASNSQFLMRVGMTHWF